MSRRSELFRLLFDLRCNPFPKEAITRAGIDSPFYKGLYPDIERRMADAFLGAAKPPPVALLSSLGEGGEARGFGKTRYLLWFADQINQDLGQRSLELAGARDAHSGALAVYVSFDTVGITSLSHLLFDIVCDALAAPLLPSVAYDRRAVETAATKLIINSQEPWSPWLLYWLSNGTLEQVARFLCDGEIFRAWHRARWGRELFRTLVAFVRALGVDRIVVLVDQVEDFASWDTPAYKLRRDFGRLSALLGSDPVLRGHVTFVLTLHPASARVLSRYWPVEQVGIWPRQASPNALLLEVPRLVSMIGMVKAYLDTARVRHCGDRLRPFTEDALHAVYAFAGGRPGHCLPLLSTLLDIAADLNVGRIDATAVAQWTSHDEQFGGRDA